MQRKARFAGSGAFFVAFWPFILGSALIAGGLAAIVIAYFGVAGTLHVGLQLPYAVSGGLLGLALVIVGSALLVLHALGRQARLLRRLLEESVRPESVSADGGAASPNGMVFVARGARTFHRPDCVMVEGKQTRRLRVKTAKGRGLSACRICDPV
ncbi:MAG: hypothetical protein ACRDH6_02325 [Actinomycetota bacterium]